MAIPTVFAMSEKPTDVKSSDMIEVAGFPIDAFQKFTGIFKSLPSETRNLIYAATLDATLQELERRAGGGYRTAAKPTLTFIDDTKLSLYHLARSPGEVDYILQSTDFDGRLGRIKFTFQQIKDFLDLHRDFVKQVPTSIVRLTGFLGETMDPGSGQAHTRCFAYDEGDPFGLPAHCRDSRSRGCMICEFRHFFESKQTIEDFRMKWSRLRTTGVVDPRYRDDTSLRLLSRQCVEFGVRGSLRVRWVESGGQGSGAPDAGAEEFAVEGPLGQLDWRTFGKVKVFGAWIPVGVFDPRVRPNPWSRASERLRRFIRALVLKRVIRRLEKAWTCTCGEGWYVCKSQRRDRERIALSQGPSNEMCCAQ